jgi:putative phosphoribosyl transferase
MTLFKNRSEAGDLLASALKIVGKNAIVFAVPRGGVVVGFEIADILNFPLDIIITKKIGAPGNPELAIGAVAEDGTYLLDDGVVQMLGVPQSYIRAEVDRQKVEIRRRLKTYRGDLPETKIIGLEVILVDDGVATGSTLKAALRSLQKKGAKTVTIAIPVGPADTIRELQREADRVVCLFTPEPFYAIGEFYGNFEQTTDKEVIELLRRRNQKAQMNAEKTE